MTLSELWPGASAHWTSDAPERLVVEIRWAAPDPIDAQAPARWERIAAQLEDPATTLSVGSELGAPERPLTLAERDDLLQFVDGVRLALRSGGGSTLRLTLQLDTSAGARRPPAVSATAALHIRQADEHLDIDIPLDPGLSAEDTSQLLATNFDGLLLAHASSGGRRAMAFGVLPSVVSVSAQGTPRTLAPRPVSLRPLNLPDARIDIYRPNEPPLRAVHAIADADVDLLLRDFIETLETVLDPAVTTAARSLQPEVTGPAIAAIHAAKGDIADALAGSVTHILAGDADAGLAKEAAAALREHFRRDLRLAYGAPAAVAVPMRTTASGEGDPVPRLYGTVAQRGATSSPAAATPATLEIRGQSSLVFSCVLPSGESFVDVTADYEISGLELSRAGADVPGARRLLQLHRPLTVPLGTIRVPLPRREQPAAPTLIRHSAGAAAVTAALPLERLRESKLWNYAFLYQRPSASQDTAFATITNDALPPKAPDAAPSSANARALLEALFSYRQSAEGLSAAFETLKGAPDPAAAGAVTFFASIASRVGDALRAWWPPVTAVTSAAARDALEFEIVDRAGERAAVVRGGESDLNVMVERTAADGSPLPDQTVMGEGPFWTRTVTAGRYSVVRQPAASAGMRLERNRVLVPGTATNAAFLYATRPVAFPDAAMPLLESDAHIDLAELGGTATNAGRLRAFYDALFEGAATPLVIAIDVRYFYSLIQDGSGHSLEREVEVPVLATGPVEFKDAADLASRGADAMLRDWARHARPAGQGSFVMKLTLYAADARPLLRLGRIGLPLEE